MSFKITKDDEDEDDMSDLESEDSDALASSGGASGGAADPVLFSMMKDLRKKLSKKTERAPLCDFSALIVRSNGNLLPHHAGRTAKYTGRGSRESKTIR